jgi:calcium-dependent protein kinase
LLVVLVVCRSLGVVVFVMLFGYPPFYADQEKYGAETDDRIFKLIQQGFQPVTKAGYGAHFPAAIPASEGAKDLIAKLLVQNPAQRLTAAEALEHPWLTGQTASDKPILQNVINNLKNFQASCKFKAAVLNMMSSSLTEEEMETLRRTFKQIDENNDGTITKNELKHALERSGTNEIKSEELEAILKMADVDGDGSISFEELLLTCVQKKLAAKEERIYEAFCKLDLNGDGKLSVEELEKVLTQNKQNAKELIAEVDVDHDGFVSYEEFLAMWKTKEEAAMLNKTKNTLGEKLQAAAAQVK